MAELVDAPVLGTGFARSEGSSPFIRILTVERVNNKSIAHCLQVIYSLPLIGYWHNLILNNGLEWHTT